MRTIVVLIAHGTVSSLDELEAFVTEIRRGRPPPKELLEELHMRYEKVGGSPLLALTEDLAQRVALETGLEARVAMRLWHPRLAAVVGDLLPGDRIVLVPLAPFSVEVYRSAAQAELARLTAPPTLLSIDAYGTSPELIAAWCDGVEPLLRAAADEPAVLLQSAHSLPQVVIERGDPYERLFREAAGLVLDELRRRGVPFDEEQSGVVFQSQGAMDGAWLGPSLGSELERLEALGSRHVCVLPMGFLTEHIETLYDLDVEAKAQAEALGLRFSRAPTLNSASGLVRALARAAAFKASEDGLGPPRAS